MYFQGTSLPTQEVENSSTHICVGMPISLLFNDLIRTALLTWLELQSKAVQHDSWVLMSSPPIEDALKVPLCPHLPDRQSWSDDCYLSSLWLQWPVIFLVTVTFHLFHVWDMFCGYWFLVTVVAYACLQRPRSFALRVQHTQVPCASGNWCFILSHLCLPYPFIIFLHCTMHHLFSS